MDNDFGFINDNTMTYIRIKKENIEAICQVLKETDLPARHVFQMLDLLKGEELPAGKVDPEPITKANQG